MAAKRKSTKSPLKLIFSIIILILIAGLGWYFLGKPKVILAQDGIYLEQTEEPVLTQILESVLEPETAADSKSPELVADSEAKSALAQKTTSSQSVPKSKTEVVSKAGASLKEYSSDCDLNHPENSPLYFGNPSDAIKELEQAENYLLEKPQFVISYNSQTLCPNWVGWHLSPADLGDADRSNNFRPDTELPKEWHAVKKADYQYNSYGFDRGHVCPSADRTSTQEDNGMTFLMTNMVPQAPDCNRIVWKDLESFERQLALDGNEVYIFAGPYGSGGIGDKGLFYEIPVKTKSGEVQKMNVPEFTWKILLIMPEGEDDFSRTDSYQTIAVCVPNKQGVHKEGDWTSYVCSIDELESKLGYDFFELLPDEIENRLESCIYTSR